MHRKKLLIHLASLIVLIFLVNTIIAKFYWYSSIWFSDMPMHLLGGFWLGLFFLWFFYPKYLSSVDISKVILGVLFIGVLWEVFEYVFINYIAQNSFNILDTASDISFDLTGGLCAILYFFKKIMLVSKNERHGLPHSGDLQT